MHHIDPVSDLPELDADPPSPSTETGPAADDPYLAQPTKAAGQGAARKSRLGAAVPDQAMAAFEAGVQAVLDKYGLAHGRINLNDWPQVPNLSENSRRTYTKHAAALRRFCALVGDYNSAVMLIDYPPEPTNPPSVPALDPGTLAAYIHYRFLDRGSPVLHQDGKSAVTVLNEPLLAVGSWESTQNLEQLASVISVMHRSHHHTETFVPACPACAALSAQEAAATRPCTHPRHPPGRGWHPMHTGDPMTHPNLQEILRTMRKRSLRMRTPAPNLSIEGYLMMHDLRLIYNMLMGSNRIENLQLWTLLLVSLKLIIRPGEALEILLDEPADDNDPVAATTSFIKTRACLFDSNSIIQSVCISLAGKAETQAALLYLHPDKDTPWMCPVRHLMLYLHRTGLTSGQLFPMLSSSRDVCGPLSYTTLHSRISKAIRGAMGEDTSVGVRSIWKTAHLLAALGGADRGALVSCARHRTVDMYIRDARALISSAQLSATQALRIAVPKWIPTRFPNDLPPADVANNRPVQDMPLLEYARIYVETHCESANDEPVDGSQLLNGAQMDEWLRNRIRQLFVNESPEKIDQLERLVDMALKQAYDRGLRDASNATFAGTSTNGAIKTSHASRTADAAAADSAERYSESSPEAPLSAPWLGLTVGDGEEGSASNHALMLASSENGDDLALQRALNAKISASARQPSIAGSAKASSAQASPQPPLPLPPKPPAPPPVVLADVEGIWSHRDKKSIAQASDSVQATPGSFGTPLLGQPRQKRRIAKTSYPTVDSFSAQVPGDSGGSARQDDDGRQLDDMDHDEDADESVYLDIDDGDVSVDDAGVFSGSGLKSKGDDRRDGQLAEYAQGALKRTASRAPKRARTSSSGLLPKDNLDGRLQIASLATPTEKINAIIRISEKLPPTGQLTDAARSWVSNEMRPTMHCLGNHFGGVIDDFLAHHGMVRAFVPSTFKRAHCTGHGNVCTRFTPRKPRSDAVPF
ncbi:hypothetical protein HK105_200898 [Polyrhizophydium stewartii]|uniref:Uncharacterized protein n=1 Tax=Polyrhizophydium stewartii TaxID=2732419 RepID=A0ABR4NIA7_9FUNG|nr:hypothetical protein HK105_005627 [Polyrhizophydium stewartii]